MNIWTYAKWLRQGKLDKILDLGMIEMDSFDNRSNRKYFAESQDWFIYFMIQLPLDLPMKICSMTNKLTVEVMVASF